MSKIQNKKQALEELSKLPEKEIIRVAELSKHPKARSYFSNPISFAALKGFLG